MDKEKKIIEHILTYLEQNTDTPSEAMSYLSYIFESYIVTIADPETIVDAIDGFCSLLKKNCLEFLEENKDES